MPWFLLTLAIIGEIVGTTALKLSEGFTRPLPGIVAIIGYAVAFYFLAMVLRTIPIGVAYAVWSGVGVAAMALIGLVMFGQKLEPAAIIGITLIVAGVVVLNTMSGTSGH
ncbi:DMT family transporter [Pontivivens nitratireducens]|uniref:Multidrug efflux SMR transporter n=1 Tax=Pontivivens nitratireducens TaxID=2758038 RepID=A0A6G7VN68_9RHOB|nr:multidrug efflux SMR transporter [Pontibrevibacter nitratireducens]QIK41360.1 multidrug efflux SMR transporter [Pontibrevibacter nitratireducens]